MQRALRLLGILAGVTTVGGCCGPCARWIMSNATSSSSGADPLPGASGGAEETPGAGNNGGGAAQNNVPGSPRTSTGKHPFFPGRRGYIEYRSYFKSGGARIAQLADPQTAFDSMPRDGQKSPTGGLVVCRIQVKGRFDDFRGADTAASLTVGSRQYDFYGPEDTDLVYFSVPRAPWAAGEKLTLSVWDRDLTTNEDIGTVTGTIGNVPLSLTAKNMDVDCRAWPGETVEEKARAAQKRATDAASRARAAKPVPAEREWGYERSGIAAAWKEVDELAAFVGWDDPRVRSAGADLEKIEADWTSAAEKSVAAEVAKLPPLSKSQLLHLNDVDATVQSVTCDTAKAKELLSGSKAAYRDVSEIAPCIVEIRGTRTSPADNVFVITEMHVRGALVFADGSEIGLTDVQLMDAKGNVPSDFQWTPAAGESFTVRFLPAGNVAIGTHPGAPPDNRLGPAKLLRFDSRQKSGAPAFVRLDG